MKVIAGVYSGVSTVELDTLAAETAASLTTKHPDYAILAARIAVSNLHKETKKLFSGKSLYIIGGETNNYVVENTPTDCRKIKFHLFFDQVLFTT